MKIKSDCEIETRSQKSSCEADCQKKTITPEILKTIVSYFGQDKKNLMNWRFICMCLLGYYVVFFFRFSEIANIKRSDTKIYKDRLEIYVSQSKTDKFKKGARTIISAMGNNSSVCPKLILMHCLALTKISDSSEEFSLELFPNLDQSINYIRPKNFHMGDQERFYCRIWKR